MSIARLFPLVASLRRACAAGSAALIFALGLFAVSPSLHQQLHHGADMMAHDQCAVVLFASGVAVPLVATAPMPPVAEWHQPRAVASPEILLGSTRYRLQPGCGPPVA